MLNKSKELNNMNLEEYARKRVEEEDELKELAYELLIYYYEDWSKEELAELGITKEQD
jgi:hypothetical protein